MIIAQDRVPILGRTDLWQVLLEYEHDDRDSLQITGFRLNWLGGPVPEDPGDTPIEMVYRGDRERLVIYQNSEPMNDWWDRERYLQTYFRIEKGDLVQIRAKFPCPVELAHVVLF